MRSKSTFMAMIAVMVCVVGLILAGCGGNNESATFVPNTNTTSGNNTSTPSPTPSHSSSPSSTTTPSPTPTHTPVPHDFLFTMDVDQTHVSAYGLDANASPSPVTVQNLPSVANVSASQPTIAINQVDVNDVYAYVINSTELVSTAKANIPADSVTSGGVSQTAGNDSTDSWTTLAQTIDPTGKYLYVATANANFSATATEAIDVFPITNGTLPATGTLAADNAASGSAPHHLLPNTNEAAVVGMVATTMGSSHYLVVIHRVRNTNGSQPNFVVLKINDSTGALSNIDASGNVHRINDTGQGNIGNLGNDVISNVTQTPTSVLGSSTASGPVIYVGFSNQSCCSSSPAEVQAYTLTAAGNLTAIAPEQVVGSPSSCNCDVETSALAIGTFGSSKVLYAATTDDANGSRLVGSYPVASNGTLTAGSFGSALFPEPLNGGWLKAPSFIQSLCLDPSNTHLILGLNEITSTVPFGNFLVNPVGSDGSITFGVTPLLVQHTDQFGTISLTPLRVTF